MRWSPAIGLASDPQDTAGGLLRPLPADERMPNNGGDAMHRIGKPRGGAIGSARVAATAVVMISSLAASQAPGSAAPRRMIAILVYDGVQVQDFAGPFEVFSRLNRDSVFLVSKDGRPVRTWRGLTVVPTFALGASPKPDVVVIPGGNPGKIATDSTVLNWIRSASADSAYVLSVCTGAGFLLRAGVLDNREATTFWRQQESLRRDGAARGVRVVSDRLVVDAGRVVTSAGTGIEGALLVLGKLHGEAWQRLTALHMDVNAEPGLEATVRPTLADRNLPTAIDEFIPDGAELLDYSGGRESWNAHWRYASPETVAALSARFVGALQAVPRWRRDGASIGGEATSRWAFTGRDSSAWLAAVRVDKAGNVVDLTLQVWKAPK